ncbi:MAG: ribonuclease III [Candidatus Magasanikbacteria bacterium]
MIEAYKEKNFEKFEEKIGIEFENKKYLVQAFVHRSFINESRDFPLHHNERLEFLGDAVLELSVTEYLFRNYLNPEGELTNWRAALVNAEMCSRVARELEMNPYLFLSKGEAQDENSKARDYILANAIEALIGAIYLDQGFETADEFIREWIVNKLPEVLEQGLWMDPKSRFQEAAQEKVGITPTYDVLQEEGPDHDKSFLVGVFLDDKKIAAGTGSSKQEAQENAANKAMKKKGWGGPDVKVKEREPGDPLG